MQELYCDICGKSSVRAQIMVEGAKLLACAACMKSGKILHRFNGGEAPQTSWQPPSAVESSEEIIEGFGKTIRDARERIRLPLAVIAERIKEKESYLNAIEHERLMPTIEVARKLEKELGIKLVEKVQSVSTSSRPIKGFSEPTLADMLGAKKKGK